MKQIHIFIVALMVSTNLLQAKDKMNLVFFLVDDLGYGDLGVTGAKIVETPNTDKFAKETFFFTSAYTAAPSCTPTRASILSGKYPARLHLTTWMPDKPSQKKTKFRNWKMPQEPLGMSGEEYTLAEALKDNGYVTAHIGKWHIGYDDRGPLAQGFDVDYGFKRSPKIRKPYFSPYKIPSLADGTDGEHITDRLTDEAIKFMKENKDKPFFVNLWHYDVHTPLRSKNETIEKYLQKGAPKEGKDNATYLAMKESIDISFGRILTALKELDLEENTIVVFFSDNGGVEAFADNGIYRGGKKTLYEGGVRVPLFIRDPRLINQNIKIDEPVSSIDFYPTFLEMLDIDASKIPQEFDGISFAPLLRDKRIKRENNVLFWHFLTAFRYGPASSVRQGDYKLIKYYATNKLELYNLKNDPSEKKDISKKHPKIVARLEMYMEEWKKSVNALMPIQENTNKSHLKKK